MVYLLAAIPLLKEAERRNFASLKPNSCVYVCARVRKREGEKKRDTSETFAYMVHYLQYLSISTRTEL